MVFTNDISVSQVGVFLGCADIRVTHKKLERPEVPAVDQVVLAEGMPYSVCTQLRPIDPGLLHVAMHNIVDPPGAKWPLVSLEDMVVPIPAVSECQKEPRRLFADGNIAMAGLAPDADHLLSDVLDLKVGQFSAADTGINQECQDGPVPGAGSRAQETHQLAGLEGGHSSVPVGSWGVDFL